VLVAASFFLASPHSYNRMWCYRQALDSSEVDSERTTMFPSRVAMKYCLRAVVVLGALCRESEAAWTFIGPTPYLSKADSPFPVDGSNPNFYLEDFEDGLLNSPGLFQPLLPITHGTVSSPSEETDSVDLDDGAVDGLGRDGHSLRSNAYIVFPIDPPVSWSDARFGFDAPTLGFHPNAFGFVWTDGIAPSAVLVEVFDAQWNLLAYHEYAGLGDSLSSGQTDEDRLLGVVCDSPFAFVQITSKYAGPPGSFEIDHVQYGAIEVPEGSALVSALAGIVFFVFTVSFFMLRFRRVVAVH
jgi:hypothetical protein